MNILISAFECSPSIGSDAYVGWSWAKQLSYSDKVHVLTRNVNRASIENYLKNNNDLNATFHYIAVPRILGKILKGRKYYFASYAIWQWYAYKVAKELDSEVHFDIVHHVSIADFRIIGSLWKLDIPFIFGPVGGGRRPLTN